MDKIEIHYKHFGALLRYLRVEKGISQRELAEIVGVSRSAIAMYEIGARLPNRTNVRTIVEILDIDMSVYYYLLF